MEFHCFWKERLLAIDPNKHKDNHLILSIFYYENPKNKKSQQILLFIDFLKPFKAGQHCGLVVVVMPTNFDLS
jgi:hypothetical protein